MTTYADIVNLGLQTIGTKTTVTATELANETSNEAIQANLILHRTRKSLLRKAPWDCGMKVMNLQYITSTPGTPENTSPATSLWQPGQPPLPWAYEYQYPVNCERACWIIPALQTGFTNPVPITPAVTGGVATAFTPPVKFKIQTDEFYPVLTATVAAGGTGYAVGDEITLDIGPTDEAPIGGPAKLTVLTLTGSAVATVEVQNQIVDSDPVQGGSYFAPQTTAQAQGSTTGSGTGATFNLTFGAKGKQRVILTNQEYATLAFVEDVIDPNVMDQMFQDAWAALIGAHLSLALTGDKTLANLALTVTNDKIAEARKADANEGLTINNVTPDFIRARGITYNDYYSGPYAQTFDWGGFYPMF